MRGDWAPGVMRRGSVAEARAKSGGGRRGGPEKGDLVAEQQARTTVAAERGESGGTRVVSNL